MTSKDRRQLALFESDVLDAGGALDTQRSEAGRDGCRASGRVRACGWTLRRAFDASYRQIDGGRGRQLLLRDWREKSDLGWILGVKKWRLDVGP